MLLVLNALNRTSFMTIGSMSIYDSERTSLKHFGRAMTTLWHEVSLTKQSIAVKFKKAGR